MSDTEQPPTLFDEVADAAVDLGNRLMAEHPEADPWEIGSALLAGAVHFWLYTRQPCGDPACEDCAEIATAEQRYRQLLEELRYSAEESTYYHTPFDTNVGRA